MVVVVMGLAYGYEGGWLVGGNVNTSERGESMELVESRRLTEENIR